jgi:hypothetical protein
MRAHPVVEADRAGVALDDLVQPLAGQAGAAAVDEQVGLVAEGDEGRAPALDVDPRRRDGLAPDRDLALLGALASGAQHAERQVDVAHVEADGLRGAQAAGVHELEQGAIAQRRGIGPLRRAQQAGDLVAAEDLRQALALARRAQVGRRIAVEHALAAQVAVEGAQARGLALQRGGRHRWAVLAAGRQLAQEGAEVLVVDLGDIDAAAPEERPQLQQVRAIGLQRVAREPALELQVGQEVQHPLAHPAVGGGSARFGRGQVCSADGHGPAGLRPRRQPSLPLQRRVRASRSPRPRW